MFAVTDGQFDLVYNSLSFTLACMMASTIFFWIRVGSIHEKYKSALVITGLVTFIAAYHYFRIFNSWTEAYEFGPAILDKDTGVYEIQDPTPTGKSFNDAYRYMDWLLTVPLLLIEIVLVMKLSPEETFSKSAQLGVASGLMIIIGYPGELIIEGPELSKRWLYWACALIPFMYVVYELMFGLKAALDSEADPKVRANIWLAQRMTIVSWLTYPVVYIIPMLGASGAGAVVGIQIGYCISDIISKCGVGLLIYKITVSKSYALGEASPLKGYGTQA